MAIQLSGSLAMSGSIIATGEIIAQMLNVQQVTSSVIYSSGSNIFGNSLSNTQQFTGSVLVTGSLTVSGPISGTGPTQGTIVYGSTVACSPVGCFATSCATSFVGGTISGTTSTFVNGIISGTPSNTSSLLLENFNGDQTATTLRLKSGRSDVFYHMQAFSSNTSEVFRIESSGRVVSAAGACFAGAVCSNTVSTTDGTNISTLANNYLRYNGGDFYVDACAVGGNFRIRTSNTTALDSTALFICGKNSRIGIGTSTPNALLNLYSGTEANLTFTSDGAGGDQGAVYVLKGTGGGLTFAVENRDFIWRTGTSGLTNGGGCERMRLDSSGNVTIGSTSAGNAGTINVSVGCAGTTAGGLQLWATSAQTHYLQFGDGTAGAGPYAGYVGYTHSTDSLLLGAGASTRATISSTGVACFSSTVCAPMILASGCVGVNITDPLTRLHVQFAGTTTTTCMACLKDGALVLYNANAGSSTNGTVGIFGQNAGALGLSSGIGFSRESSANWGTQLRFYTHPTTTSEIDVVCERMRITGDGCISVGTTCTLGRLTIASEAGTSGITLLNTTAATLGTETQFITWEGLTNGSALHACPLGRIGVINVNGGTSIGTMVFYTKQYNAGICERMRITSDGYVGIGVTSPSLILHTSADGAAGQIMADQYGAVGSNILLRSARGTSASPTATQAGDLLGSIGSRGYDGSAFSGAGRAGVYMYAGENFTSTNQGTFLIIGTTALGATSRTERIRVTTEGNVGIGNTSPLTKLVVNNAIAGAILPYVQGTGLSYNNEGISVAGSNTNNTNIGNGLTLYNNVASVGAYGPVVAWSSMTVGGAYNATYAFVTGVYGGAGGDNNWAIGDLIFGTAESYGATERMRIRNNGNVGIGTTSPNYKLEVSGNACFTGGVAIGGSYCAFALNVHGVTYQIGGSVWVQNGYGYVNSGATTTGLFPSSDCSIQLRIANNAALTINASNNVGIGTTNPQKPLEIRTGGSNTTPSQIFFGGISQVIVGGEAQLAFSSNISPTTGTTTASELTRAGIGFQYVSAALPSEFSIGIQCTNVCNSNVRFFNGVERMRITSAGVVGIGTTSTSTEANLFLGAQGTVEGGQLVLQRGTNCSCATHLDNYNDSFRILVGTDTGSTGVHMLIDHKTRNACFYGQVQTICGINSAFYNGSGARYNFTSLNTAQTLVGICANNGILVIRDHTTGGTGAFLIDPNMGVICMASNIPATVAIAYNSGAGSWFWCLTSGSVPRCLGYGFYGA